VASLVDKSMLDDEETADGAVRYRMLETLRQYALERLAESGKVDTWRRRHAEHYVHAADEIGTALFGAGEGVWRLQMLVELDNFRAAATWGLDRDDAGDNALAMQIVAALALEAFHAPSTSVGSWAEQALPHLANATPGQQTTILGAAAMAAMVRGDYERAGERARAAWDVEDAAPSTRLMSFPFLALSYSQLVSGHHQAAVETLADGERVCRAAGVGDWDLSHILTSLAIFRAMGPHGDPHALTNADEAVRLARGLGNEWLISGSLHAVAWAIVRRRQRANLPPCPTAADGSGPAALRGVVVECAADGSAVDVARALAGHRVVLNLWAYWCIPCSAELPAMAEYQRRAGSDVIVATVHQDENETAALLRLAQLGVRLPTLQDGRRRVAAALRVPNVMPATVVLRPDGSVAQVLPRPFASADAIQAAVGDQS